MYERFFNLRERPFSLSPDPAYLYPSRVHREALNYVRFGIEGHAGFVVLTGEIGSGKTTLLQTVLMGLDQHTSVSRLVNTMLDARELLEAILLDFGLDPGHGRSKPYLLRELARFLVEQRTAGRLALLVVDEAQNLNPSALEELRMISNLETEKSKLIQIMLVGQPSLRYLLAEPALEQLQQRVTVSYHLEPLDSEETAAYVNHRLRRAALGAPLEFSRDVTELIHRHSGGIPRKINVIADAVLLFGYGEDRHTIDVDLTNIVLGELEGTGVLARTPIRVRVPEADTIAALTSREPEFAARRAALVPREDRIAGHGPWMRRRDEREYAEYLREESGGKNPPLARGFQSGGVAEEAPAARPAPVTTQPGSERRTSWLPARRDDLQHVPRTSLASRELAAAASRSTPPSTAALRGADPYYREGVRQPTGWESFCKRIRRGLLGD